MLGQHFTRRRFLAAASGLAVVGLGPRRRSLLGAEPPAVVHPRATDGDERHEPAWDERLTVTVGPRGADLVGVDDKVIQAAVEYVTRWGGGTVKLLPGTYTLRNAVHLGSGNRIQGSGSETVITKIASPTVALADDSDWYDQEITLSDARPFRVGDGVVLRAQNPDGGGRAVIKRTLVARCGNRFRLNDGLRENLWLSGTATCASLFPLLTSEQTSDVVIEDLTLDGNGQNNDHLDGNYAGCIFLQDCNRFVIRRVEAGNYNGDGISFQVCHDVVIDECHSHDNTGLGLHPGSGSQRPIMRRNRLEHNNIGLFWCWGVKYGLAEGNQMHANRSYGISIGHNDTNNVMFGNVITDSGKVGILFRNEARGRDFWANRNRLEKNQVINSGGADGIAIDIQGQTKELTIVANELRETREPRHRTGIRVGADAGPITLEGNTIEGFAQAIRDERPATS
jgi:hypothetical protein